MHDDEFEDELPPEEGFDTTSFLTGILVGAAVGAGIALLFAPASGSETRRLIRRRAQSLQKEVSRSVDPVRDEVRRSFKEKKEALRERLAKGLDAIEDELGV